MKACRDLHFAAVAVMTHEATVHRDTFPAIRCRVDWGSRGLVLVSVHAVPLGIIGLHPELPEQMNLELWWLDLYRIWTSIDYLLRERASDKRVSGETHISSINDH